MLKYGNEYFVYGRSLDPKDTTWQGIGKIGTQILGTPPLNSFCFTPAQSLEDMWESTVLFIPPTSSSHFDGQSIMAGDPVQICFPYVISVNHPMYLKQTTGPLVTLTPQLEQATVFYMFPHTTSTTTTTSKTTTLKENTTVQFFLTPQPDPKQTTWMISPPSSLLSKPSQYCSVSSPYSSVWRFKLSKHNYQSAKEASAHLVPLVILLIVALLVLSHGNHSSSNNNNNNN